MGQVGSEIRRRSSGFPCSGGESTEGREAGGRRETVLLCSTAFSS
jgi:hypothetical protein